MKFIRASALLALFGILTGLTPAQQAFAEAKELRIARQFGIAYLPLLIVQKQQLIEKHAKKNRLDNLKVSWVQLGSGAAVNEALLSGNLDFAAAGVPPFLTLWDKTRGNADVRIASGFNNIPVFLNTSNLNVKSIEDFSPKDRIALAAVKVSLHAIVLQMAAAKAWGQDNFSKLDSLTVSMKHPDGMIALLSGRSEITAHFTSPPYMFEELEHPGIRTVLNSADVIGQHSFNVVYTTNKFRMENPRLYKSYLEALDEAMAIIKADTRSAARVYLEAASMKPDRIDSIHKMIIDPSVDFSTVPTGLQKFADFMQKVGTLKRTPEKWQDLCFPEAAAKPGS